MAHRTTRLMNTAAADDKKPTDAMPQQFGDPKTVEITDADPNYNCCFCQRHEINPTEWGVMLKLEEIITHHFCLLFSALVEQRGRDDEGIHGFLLADIRKEVRRGNRLKCKFCKKNHATIGCGIAKCSTSFHYTCGYENKCLNQFYGQFLSYCFKHKPKQLIPNKTSLECPICMVETETDDAIWPPCCGKQLFHRRCIMFTAKAAGYFFKCPLCNSNTPTFIQAMKANGVYVPDQDAAWELEPNAFEDLLDHYATCDAKLCLCPDGREFTSENGTKDWHLIRCDCCGSSATHMKCSDLNIYKWKCKGCKIVFLTSGVKDPDGAGVLFPDDSESTTSDSSDESSSEEEILPNLPDISSVINFHKVPTGTLPSPPLRSSHLGEKLASNKGSPETTSSSPTEPSNKKPAVESRTSPGSFAFEYPLRNRIRNNTTPPVFQQKLEQLRLTSVRGPDKEQSVAEKEAKRQRIARLHVFLNSKSLERKEERCRVRTDNSNRDLERTQQMLKSPPETEHQNSPTTSSVATNREDGIVPQANNGREPPENGVGIGGSVRQLRTRKFFNSTPYQEFTLEEKKTQENQCGNVTDGNNSGPHAARASKRLTPADIKDHQLKISGLKESLYNLANGTGTGTKLNHN